MRTANNRQNPENRKKQCAKAAGAANAVLAMIKRTFCAKARN